MYDVLAILGRGIQKITPHGGWVLTEDLEMYGENGGHLIVREPVDDKSTRCLIGGGELNLLAGLELFIREGAKTVVYAYGHRATYLREIDGPTESEVMSRRFAELLEKEHHGWREPRIVIWPRDRDVPGPSNTRAELENILELARENRGSEIAIVSVAVHLPRAMVFAEKHQEKPAFRDQSLDFFSSEEILLEADAAKYAPRVLNIYASEAMRRTAEREAQGVQDFLAGKYGVELEGFRPPEVS